MEDWIGKRISPVPDGDQAELNSKLNALVKCFDLNWLQAIGQNPIQILWQRKDCFATSELLLLGEAIEKLLPVDHDWVARRVRRIKTRQPSERIGDVFELVGLGMLSDSNQKVYPARENQPGFDGLITTKNCANWYFSMKNYGISRSEEGFRTWCQKTTDKFVAFLEAWKLNGLHLCIQANEFPSPTKWQELLSKFDETLAKQLVSALREEITDGYWTLRVLEVPFSNDLASGRTSYQTTVLAPFHANEKVNLLSQIADGAANFEKHAASFTETDSFKCLFLCLSATASPLSCQEWCRQYFLENSTSTIDVIAGYQISICNTGPENEPSIFHLMFSEPRPGLFSSLTDLENMPNLNVLIGRVASSEREITFANSQKKILDHYVFQRGDIYCRPKIGLDGSLVGEMRYVADGVQVHCFFGDRNSNLTSSGNLLPSHQVLLFT